MAKKSNANGKKEFSEKKYPKKTIDRNIYYPPALYRDYNTILSNMSKAKEQTITMNGNNISMIEGFVKRNKKYLKTKKKK